MLRVSALLRVAPARAATARMLCRHLSYPPHQVLGLPALSPTMTQGNISKYLVKVGDTVDAGDRIAEIETDKATVDFDVVDAGTVAKILLAEGTQDVQVGTPMIVLADDAADVSAFADFTVSGESPATPAPAAPTAAAPAPTPAPVAAPVPVAAAPVTTVAPVQLTGSLPAISGRIYWNETKGWFRA